MADRQEFTFVVDGLELSERQKEQIGLAIQKAALNALTEVRADLETPVIIGHGSFKLNPEWRGLWLLNGRLGDEYGQKFQDAGFTAP